MIKLELSVEDINGILYALGELKTNTFAWLLIGRIKEQADPQVQELEEQQKLEKPNSDESNNK